MRNFSYRGNYEFRWQRGERIQLRTLRNEFKLNYLCMRMILCENNKKDLNLFEGRRLMIGKNVIFCCWGVNFWFLIDCLGLGRFYSRKFVIFYWILLIFYRNCWFLNYLWSLLGVCFAYFEFLKFILGNFQAVFADLIKNNNFVTLS